MDERLRAMRRRWRSSGDVAAGATYLVESLRAGSLTPLHVMCAAVLGEPAAERARVEAGVLIVVPDAATADAPAPVARDVWRPLTWAPPELLVRCGLAAARHVVGMVGTSDHDLLESAQQTIDGRDDRSIVTRFFAAPVPTATHAVAAACAGVVALRGDHSARLALRERYPTEQHYPVALWTRATADDELRGPPGPGSSAAWAHAARFCGLYAGHHARIEVVNRANATARQQSGRLDRVDLATATAEAALSAAVAMEVMQWLLDPHDREPWVLASASVPWPQVPASAAPRPYASTDCFGVGEALIHPKFGPGTVQKVTGAKIEVDFADGVRTLVHALRP